MIIIQTEMREIIEAIIMVSEDPKSANQQLNYLSRRQKEFFNNLLQIIIGQVRVEEYFNGAQAQYRFRDTSLVIMNRFLTLSMQSEYRVGRFQVDDIFKNLKQILLCTSLTLASKRKMHGCLKEVVGIQACKPATLIELVSDLATTDAMNAAYVLMEAILAAEIEGGVISYLIKELFDLLMYIAQQSIEELVSNFKSNSNQIMRIYKQNIYIIEQLFGMVKFICKRCQKLGKQQKNASQAYQSIAFNPKLAQYILAILQIQSFIGRNEGGSIKGLSSNPKIISLSLSSPTAPPVNELKLTALKIYNSVIELTDGKFNLKCTQKLLMMKAEEITLLVITDLLQFHSNSNSNSNCSKMDQHLDRLIGEMFKFIGICCKFQDLYRIFASLDIEKILKLTLGYLQANEKQMQLFNQCSEEYIIMMDYICYGMEMELELDQLEVGVNEEIVMHSASCKGVATFIYSFASQINGLASILLDICHDIIFLHIMNSVSYDSKNIAGFNEKYNISVGDKYKMSEGLLALSIISPLLSMRYKEVLPKIMHILSIIDLPLLTQLQIARVYIFLTKNVTLFKMEEVQLQRYSFIQFVFKIPPHCKTIRRIAFQFIQALVVGAMANPSQSYLVFIDRLMRDYLLHFNNSDENYENTSNAENTSNTDALLFQIFENILDDTGFERNYITMDWINMSMETLMRGVRGQPKCRKDGLLQYASVLQKLVQISSNLLQGCKDQSCMRYDDQIDRNYQLVYEILSNQSLNQAINLASSHFQHKDEPFVLEYSILVNTMLYSQFSLQARKIPTVENQFKILRIYSKLQQNTRRYVFQNIYALIVLLHEDMPPSILGILCVFLSENIRVSEQITNECSLIIQLLLYYQHHQFPQMHDLYEVSDQLSSAFLLQLVQTQNKYQLSGPQKYKQITLLRMFNAFLYNPKQCLLDTIMLMKNHMPTSVSIFDLNVMVNALEMMLNHTAFDQEVIMNLFDMISVLLVHYQKISNTEEKLLNVKNKLKCVFNSQDPYQKSNSLFIMCCQNHSLKAFFHNHMQFITRMSQLANIRSINQQPRIVRKIHRSTPTLQYQL